MARKGESHSNAPVPKSLYPFFIGVSKLWPVSVKKATIFLVNKVVLEHSQHLFIYIEQRSMAAIALPQQS